MLVISKNRITCLCIYTKRSPHACKIPNSGFPGIFTIGVSPPHYEVNGIPPMYYEEAKGEKITSGSPSVVSGVDEAIEAGNNTQM